MVVACPSMKGHQSVISLPLGCVERDDRELTWSLLARGADPTPTLTIALDNYHRFVEDVKGSKAHQDEAEMLFSIEMPCNLMCPQIVFYSQTRCFDYSQNLWNFVEGPMYRRAHVWNNIPQATTDPSEWRLEMR